MRSKLFRLNARDLVRGLIVAFLSSLVSGIYQILATGTWFSWDALRPILAVAISAAIGYLLTNLATNNKGELLTPDKPV